MQEGNLVLPARQPQIEAPGDGSPPPAKAKVPQPGVNILHQQNVVHETLMLQQNVPQEGCSWQDTRDAIEAIKEVAERRHQEVLQWIASQA